MKTQYKFYFRKIYSKAIVTFLSMMGFAAGCVRAEYGCPSADFKLTGTVKSEATQAPIKNIQISMGYDFDTTESDGNFELLAQMFPDSGDFFKLRIEDIDSTENQLFQTLDTVVEFPSEDFEGGDGDWYRGTNTQTITIFLKEKESKK